MNFLYVYVFLMIFSQNVYSHEIREYQDKTDYEILHNLIAGNKELWTLGTDDQTRIQDTEKFLASEKYITKVCVKDNKPIGFITYVKESYKAPLIDINNFDPKKMPEPISQGAVQLLAVDKAYQRQGFGKALMQHALQDMRSKKVEAVMIQTKIKNNASRALYEKIGFTLLMPIPDEAILQAANIEDCFYKFIF